MDEARPEVGGGINFPKVKLEVIDLTSSLEVESIHTYGGVVPKIGVYAPKWMGYDGFIVENLYF